MPWSLLGRRLLWALPTLFGVLVVVFVLLRVAPGDPVAMMIGPGATADDIRALRAVYGLDRSLPAQFGVYLGQAVHGDFGRSITQKQDVSSLVAARLPLTLELSALALLIACVLGVGTAMAAVGWRGAPAERGVDAATGFVTAIPDFLWGLAGILFLGVLVPVLPVFGLLDSDIRFDSHSGFVLGESLVRGRFDVFGSALLHLAWPALSLALPLAAMIARVLKASLLEVLAEDYILIARVKGFGPWHVLWREALRNALGPALTPGRRAVHLPHRRHRADREAVRPARPRQHGDRRRDQPRPAAHPGHRAHVRAAFHRGQHRRRRDQPAPESEAARMTPRIWLA